MIKSLRNSVFDGPIKSQSAGSIANHSIDVTKCAEAKYRYQNEVKYEINCRHLQEEERKKKNEKRKTNSNKNIINSLKFKSLLLLLLNLYYCNFRQDFKDTSVFFLFIYQKKYTKVKEKQ